MTDWDCDNLFSSNHEMICSPVSRLVCDMERFREEEKEEMAEKGMGAVYTRASDGSVLRNVSPEERETVLRTYYDPHHKRLTEAAEKRLDAFGRCLIIDGHSFPEKPLPCDISQKKDRPDFCIGTDRFHTPPGLADEAVSFLERKGYRVCLNDPFSGAIVPIKYYEKDVRVSSVMIEINRNLYRGDGKERYCEIKETVGSLVNALEKWYNKQTSYPHK